MVQDGCVSSIDIVNSKSCEIQIDKNSPTLMIDKVRIFVFLACAHLCFLGRRQARACCSLACVDTGSDDGLLLELTLRGQCHRTAHWAIQPLIAACYGTIYRNW